jgi:hypothetical protein
MKLEEEPEPFYEIRLVSPELLDRILGSSDPEDEILKIGPGMIIGISSNQILYIRSDLQTGEYLIKNRITTDMKEKITEHLIDIALGRGTPNTSLLKSDLKYKFWFDAIYTQDDIDTVIRFARLFNNLSATTQFEDDEVILGELKTNYEIIPNYYYNINIVPKQYLDDYKENKYQSSSEKIIKNKDGEMIGIMSEEYTYLWDGLIGKERDYYLTRSLFWSTGLHGESSLYSDSFFYDKVNTSATLSILDMEAIKLLYGGRLNTGITADEIRKALDISK